MSNMFFRDSSDPDPKVQKARELFAEKTRLFNEGKITEAELDEARSQLNTTIAKIKNFSEATVMKQNITKCTFLLEFYSQMDFFSQIH